ncbi:hypothetical protein CC1G_09284 [Coprinopsis cinerea okayama7|uniref:DUF6533 domain-containing protein n=1 Tax=Coprinopsis cinerea (strain Okayama-7 / 130 / ATCC MYA-4618 / FGSC 9003) TaxID=240176 RepID=A8N863_COPC7|nr:hypothetical protein CC1G_09284 [Coprinopsis cinerea okayama7\|eukprot:XP_001831019.1 hypothetical protein CC1G_09284 [Coprinopsis cinerea okayama7\
MLQEFFAFNGIAISCVTILIHDYFCTLPYEVEYVWKSPWSIGLPLFFVNRYLPFFDQTILTHFGMITFKSDALCERLFKAGLWMMVIGANFRSHIIFLQTCAIWGSPRLLVIFLGTLQAARVVVSVVLVHLQWSDALYPVVPELGGHCAVFTPYNYARWGYLTGCIVEAITITFTLIKAFQHLRNSNSSWVSQLYRNGIVYCIIIFLFSLVNIIIPEVPLPSPIYAGLMTRPQRLMESILCNRLMFIIFQYRKRASAYRVPRRLGLSRYYESKSGAAGHHQCFYERRDEHYPAG